MRTLCTRGVWMSGVVAALAGTAFGQSWTATIINPVDVNDAFINRAGGGKQVGFGYGTATGGNTHAFLWSGTAASAVDLNPPGYDGTFAYGCAGGQQVGVGFVGGDDQAVLWTGTAASIVNLTPEGSTYAAAMGTDGSRQAGYSRTTLGTHAFTWTGTAASGVDLHPAGYNESYAYAVDGSAIAGTLTDGAEMYNAGAWTGPSAEQFVPLHPTDFSYDETTAEAVSGTTVGGRGYGFATGGRSHALLWVNFGESIVDLHPGTDYLQSYIMVMRGNAQGGLASLPPDGDREHAVAWEGTATSMVDLHDLIPGGPWKSSRVTGIDSDGTLYGYAVGPTQEGPYAAVKWVRTAQCGPADIGTTGGTAGADNRLDNNDFIVFIDLFFAQDARADRGTTGGVPGTDGVLDNNDFIVFIDQFFGGC